MSYVLQLDAGQAGLREYLDGLETQLQQLQTQLTEQEVAAGEHGCVGVGAVWEKGGVLPWPVCSD
jgi:hypothetical protein